MLNVLYDPNDAQMSCGFWKCPVCERKFYTGGRALHSAGCLEEDNGYSNLIYHFGDRELETQKEREDTGYCEGLSPLGFRDAIKAKYPNLWHPPAASHKMEV